MSEYVLTPNLGLYKPDVDADEDHWGDHWNLNADKLDTVLATSGTGLFLPLAGGQMSGPILLTNNAPIDSHEAAPKSYVDALIDDLGDGLTDYVNSTFLKLTGGTMQGPLHLKPGSPPAADEAVPKSYVDSAITAGTGNFVAKTGDTMSGNLAIQKSNPILYLHDTTADQEAYVVGQRHGANRWAVIMPTGAAETGGNVGSNFAINRYSDAGAYTGTPLWITRDDGRTNIGSGLTVNGSDQMNMEAGTGYAIIRYNNNLRHWWAGCRADNGNFNILDDSAGAIRLEIGTDGAVFAPVSLLSNYVGSYGYIVGNNNIVVRNGGAPTLAMHNTNGYAAGIMCESNGRMTLGWTGGAGENLDWQMFFDRGGYAQFRYSVYGPYFESSGTINGYDLVARSRLYCNDMMNTSGNFFVANNYNYYLQRSGGDGHWRFVDNGNLLLRVETNGNIFTNGGFYGGYLSSGGTVYAGGGVTYGWTGQTWQFHWDGYAMRPWVAQAGGELGYMVRGGDNSPHRLDLNGNGYTYMHYSWGGDSAVYWQIGWSDRRLKSDVKAPVADALAIINAVPVYQATLHPPLPDSIPQHLEFTVMADELERLLPSAVGPHDDDMPAILGPIPLIAALWRAVQQLTQRIYTLEAA